MTWKYDSSSKNFAFVFFYGKCTDKHRYTKYIRFKKKTPKHQISLLLLCKTIEEGEYVIFPQGVLCICSINITQDRAFYIP